MTGVRPFGEIDIESMIDFQPPIYMLKRKCPELVKCLQAYEARLFQNKALLVRDKMVFEWLTAQAYEVVESYVAFIGSRQDKLRDLKTIALNRLAQNRHIYNAIRFGKVQQEASFKDIEDLATSLQTGPGETCPQTSFLVQPCMVDTDTIWRGVQIGVEAQPKVESPCAKIVVQSNVWLEGKPPTKNRISVLFNTLPQLQAAASARSQRVSLSGARPKGVLQMLEKTSCQSDAGKRKSVKLMLDLA